ncbi:MULTISPECIES: DUF2018 family protein [Helicobacter]|uniref:DUF2018 family protein n=3 Tax=Helicobacter typhlonius TaxID=76936 RepID=A0A099UG47_9HELI|nr:MULTISPECIES: DUF2018 family protein [Helicobacter]TLD78655.1 DUF2018 family protein [Helicobacter typhlonius]TLD89444.1 DUF2018 family protein [Helicobacter sp. MIT 03-1616]CUU40077.1 FIG00711038: Hypothetical protein [Helicobacter typhlonius]HCD73145.1 DUF2018 domain-containing protein [Helicobacter sp.]
MDIFFEGTPLDKWKEIILNASPTLVGLELEALLERVAVYEALLEAQNIDIESAFKQYYFDEANKEILSAAKNNLAIDSMAKILGNYE